MTDFSVLIDRILALENRLQVLEDKVNFGLQTSNTSLDTVVDVSYLPSTVAVGKQFLVKSTNQIAIMTTSGWVFK